MAKWRSGMTGRDDGKLCGMSSSRGIEKVKLCFLLELEGIISFFIPVQKEQQSNQNGYHTR
jgi:hypothetical protein